MDKTNKNLLITFLYLLCFYLAICLFPFSRYIQLEWLSSLIDLLVRTIFLLWVFFEVKRSKLPFLIKSNRKISYLFLLPFVICFLSNFIWAFLSKAEPISNIAGGVFYIDLITVIVSASIEELLFRFLLLSFFLNLFKNKKRGEIIAVLLSALSFSLMHCINFYGNPPLAVVSQLGYTLILGFILGILSVKYDNLITPIIGHCLYNIFNMTLFTFFFQIDYSLEYYIYSIVLGVVAVLYSLVIYNIRINKEKN